MIVRPINMKRNPSEREICTENFVVTHLKKIYPNGRALGYIQLRCFINKSQKILAAFVIWPTGEHISQNTFSLASVCPEDGFISRRGVDANEIIVLLLVLIMFVALF